MSWRKTMYLFANIILIIPFLFIPHTIELTGTLETWFPYKGLTLYKEISMFHFPLGRIILIPIHILSNWNLELDPFVGLFVGMLSLYVIYIFGKRYLSTIASIAALFFFVVFYWYFATAILYFHEMLIGLLLAAAMLVFFDLRHSKVIRPQKLFILGLILSCAEFSGQVATVTVGIFCLFVIHLIYTKSKKRLVKVLLGRFLAGLLIPFAILSLYFLSKNALSEFIYWNTLYYLTYSGFRNTPLSLLPWREIAAFYLPLFVIGLGLIFKKKVNDNMFLFILGLSTAPFIIFSIFHFHHMNFALPLMAILAGFALDSIQNIKYKLVSILIFFAFSLPIINWHTSRMNPLPSLKIVNDVYPGDPMYDTVEWVKQNTIETDKFLVFGDPLFYMRANRLPSARPAKSIPYSWEPLDKIKAEIRKTPPAYWVIDTHSMKTIREVYQKPKMTEFVEEELSANYIKVVTFKIWEVWKRKS